MFSRNEFEILPSKHIPLQNTLLGVGAEIISILIKPMTVTELWTGLQDGQKESSYKLFIYSLDFLFMISAVSYQDGLIRKTIHAQ